MGISASIGIGNLVVFISGSLNYLQNCDTRQMCYKSCPLSNIPSVGRLWGPHSLPWNWYQAPSLGVMRPGREADHAPSSDSEVKNAWYLVKHRDNFTYIFILRWYPFLNPFMYL